MLFDFALYHLVTIAHILKQPGGSAILIGVGGCGKQSLTKLAAYLRGMKCISLDMPNYDLCTWV